MTTRTAKEEHEHARAAQRRDQAPHPGRAHLPQCGCLSAAIRALCVETHEAWLEDSRYSNMILLSEQKKEALRLAA